jgi:hypothetical protein
MMDNPTPILIEKAKEALTKILESDEIDAQTRLQAISIAITLECSGK